MCKQWKWIMSLLSTVASSSWVSGTLFHWYTQSQHIFFSTYVVITFWHSRILCPVALWVFSPQLKEPEGSNPSVLSNLVEIFCIVLHFSVLKNPSFNRANRGINWLNISWQCAFFQSKHCISNSDISLYHIHYLYLKHCAVNQNMTTLQNRMTYEALHSSDRDSVKQIRISDFSCSQQVNKCSGK